MKATETNRTSKYKKTSDSIPFALAAQLLTTKTNKTGNTKIQFHKIELNPKHTITSTN